MVTRRQMLRTASLTLLASALRGTGAGAQETGGLVIAPLIVPIPHPFASCAELEAIVQDLKGQLARFHQDRAKAGEELRHVVVAKQAEWQKLLREANSTANTEDKKLYVSAAVFATGLVLTALAVALSSPVAIGAVLGAQLLLGPLGLVAHAIARSGGDVSLVIGYTKDRTLTLFGLIGEAAQSTAGRIISRGITVLQVGLDIAAMQESQRISATAVDEAKRARQEIAQLEQLLASLGTSNIRWANVKRHLLEGSIVGLTAYLEKTRAGNCRLVPLQTGPSIHRP